MAAVPSVRSIPSVATRIILRLSVRDFDSDGFTWYHYLTAVEAYLKWANRPLAELNNKKHNIFVEPLQDPEVKQKRFHVIVDLNSLSFEVNKMDEVHHEVYEIKRKDDGSL